MIEVTVKTVLALPLQTNDFGAGTIRDFLVSLLRELWVSGRFNLDGWEFDLLITGLANAGLVVAELNEDGYLDDISEVERTKADGIILAAINHLGSA